MSAFDPTTFGAMTFKGANDTKFIPIPVGEYSFATMKAEINSWQNGDGTKSGLKLIVEGDLLDTDGKLAETTNRDKFPMKYEVMLDLTDSGMLDLGKGKNVRLGQLREACGENDPNRDFAFSMLAGKVIKVSVGHEIYKGEPMARIQRVVTAA